MNLVEFVDSSFFEMWQAWYNKRHSSIEKTSGLGGSSRCMCEKGNVLVFLQCSTPSSISSGKSKSVNFSGEKKPQMQRARPCRRTSSPAWCNCGLVQMVRTILAPKDLRQGWIVRDIKRHYVHCGKDSSHLTFRFLQVLQPLRDFWWGRRVEEDILEMLEYLDQFRGLIRKSEAVRTNRAAWLPWKCKASAADAGFLSDAVVKTSAISEYGSRFVV